MYMCKDLKNMTIYDIPKNLHKYKDKETMP